MYKKMRKGWAKHIDFLILDIIFVQLSFALAHFIKNRTFTGLWREDYRSILVFLLLMTVCVMILGDTYSGVLRRGKMAELLNVVKSVTGVFILLLVYLFIIKRTNEYSRLVLVAFWGISVLMVYAERLLHKILVGKIIVNKNALPRLLIMAEQERIEESIERVVARNFGSFVIVGAVVTDANRRGETIGGVPVVAGMEDYLEYVRTNVVDDVLIQPHRLLHTVQVVADELLNMGIAVHINFMGLTNLPNKRVEKITGFSVITSSIKEVSRLDLFFKRVLDICGSIVGLLITGIVFLIFAPIIYIQSPGPIFFRQERVGKNGRTFKIIKFRSMYLDAESRKKELMEQNKMQGLMFKMDNDPRIIPIGKFMRETSLDELPQFWNILKGDMSLVGTRPPTLDEYMQYENHHKRRLAVKPGLTGMWQVSGRSDITDFEEVVALDSEYLNNWNFLLDIKILFKTVGVVLGRRGSV